MTADQIHSRNAHSSSTRAKATELLATRIGEWADSASLGNRVCIYTTGSFGRGDASAHSDLDLFIVADQEAITNKRQLSRLEEIELLASIVHVNRELGLPELDGDGGFLKVHPLSDYLVGLGKPSDDAENTFTGRLLLLLESKPVFGEDFYARVRRECVERYWIDYSDHSESFLPAFLINDILRFWRTLCVNYEAGTTSTPAKRRAKNYKLKYSRLLTCFSAILAIQAEFQRKGTVSADQALDILSLSPLERIKRVGDLFAKSAGKHVLEMVTMYDGFLLETSCSKEDLYSKMENPEYYKSSLTSARDFGDKMFELIQAIASESGKNSPGWRFFRYITI